MDDENNKPYTKKFSLETGLSQVGAGLFDGTSIIPKEKKMKSAIQVFLRDNLKDTHGTLKKVLTSKIITNEPLLAKYPEHPLKAIHERVSVILKNEAILHELVREVDQMYGRDFQERPYFQKAGQAPHPDDEYTHQSVKGTLVDLLNLFE